MIPRFHRPPSQNWKTFLRNHLNIMVSVDFLIVPTLNYHLLYVFIVLSHHRRRILHFNVAAAPRLLGWPNNSAKPSPSYRPRGTCCATGTAFTACSSNAALRLWDWRKSGSLLTHPGSRLTSNG